MKKTIELILYDSGAMVEFGNSQCAFADDESALLAILDAVIRVRNLDHEEKKVIELIERVMEKAK